MKDEETTTTNATEIAQQDTEVNILNTIGAVTNLSPTMQLNDYIKGSLIKNGNKIDAVIQLKVKGHSATDEEYKFNTYPILIKHNNRFAIAFRYSNLKKQPDSGVDNIMNVSFNFTNQYNWNSQQEVRIIPINENDNNTFVSLIPYYLHRTELTYQSNLDELGIINDNWNNANPNLHVATFPYPLDWFFLDIKKPRLAKGDLILTVK